MSLKKISSIIKNIKDFENSLSKSVKISHNEVERITVEKLIEIRNADLTREKNFIEHFDYVIKFFLTDQEFEKYVINKNEIEEYEMQ